ncbi:MAG TPA: hypothetical protein VFG35_07170 [Actinoplanes sp.]|nr:hypothetical protein [Actinoplanes sp.]
MLKPLFEPTSGELIADVPPGIAPRLDDLHRVREVADDVHDVPMSKLFVAVGFISVATVCVGEPGGGFNAVRRSQVSCSVRDVQVCRSP